MVVVVGWQVDDLQAVLVHVDSPNIVYNMIEDNENFDKINQQLMNKMHMVHSLVKMDQYQAKHFYKTNYKYTTNLLIYENNHILYQLHQKQLHAYNYENHKTTLFPFLNIFSETSIYRINIFTCWISIFISIYLSH